MRSLIGLSASVASLYGEFFPSNGGGARQADPPMIPDYTSPPTDFALACTPVEYRDDAVIDAGRDADANGTCFDDVSACQIPFVPPSVESPRLGVVYYGGGLVDPRAYSPIAKDLAERYGIAVALQIFNRDVALFGGCDTQRVIYASERFPTVEKWVLAGHSLGGVAAFSDAWSAQNDTDSNIGGVVLMGSYVQQGLGCGETDFSKTTTPFASVSATLDLIVNNTNFELGQPFLPVNDTFHLEILGGNHGQFGSYDASERFAVLGQTDGNATIPEEVQLDLTTSAIAHVASRMGIPLAELEDGYSTTSGSGHLLSSLVVVASAAIVLSFVTSFS
jgi:hypothetical protein